MLVDPVVPAPLESESDSRGSAHFKYLLPDDTGEHAYDGDIDPDFWF